MSDDFGFDADGSKRNAKKGRRAERSVKAPAAPDFEPAGNESPQPVTQEVDDGPPKPNRVSGWGEDAPRRRGRNLGEGFEQFEESTIRGSNNLDSDQAQQCVGNDLDPNCWQRLSADGKRKELTLSHAYNERLRPRSPEKSDESDNEIPVIPDLEEQQEEDLTQKIAYAPNVAVNRVATYRELDNDLLKQAAFLTLDNEIDLKLLTKSLSTEADLLEEDKPWDWDRLFTEVTSELLTQWEKNEQTEPNEQSTMSQI